MSLKRINTIAKVNSKQAKMKIAETVSTQQLLKHELDLLKLLFNIRKKNKKEITLFYIIYLARELLQRNKKLFFQEILAKGPPQAVYRTNITLVTEKIKTWK